VQRQPASSTDHNNIGSVLAQLGRMREARAEFERALQLDPAALTREKILRGRKRNPARKNSDRAKTGRRLGDKRSAGHSKISLKLRSRWATLRDCPGNSGWPTSSSFWLRWDQVMVRRFVVCPTRVLLLHLSADPFSGNPFPGESKRQISHPKNPCNI
jgi:tetratricopeptide (TPR) repeat protein